MRLKILGTGIVLVAALAGSTACGDDGNRDAGTDRNPDRAASATPRSATPRSTPGRPTPPRSSTPPSEGKQKIRVVGEIIRTGDCVVVRADNSITWTLVGEQTEDLEVGDWVTAVGAPDLGRTGCGGPVVRTSRVTVTNTR